jgi:hypothetical protein
MHHLKNNNCTETDILTEGDKKEIKGRKENSEGSR